MYCFPFIQRRNRKDYTSVQFSSRVGKKGFNVCLLDLDLYAPSFQIYFQKEPSKGINDFLDANARIEDIMVDVTNTINNIKTVDTSNSNYATSTSSIQNENMTLTISS